MELQKPGYNRIDYDENNIKPSSWGFDVSSFIAYINENANRIWDPEKYLNIVVIPSGANMSMGTKTPQWQVVADGEEPIAGIPNVVDDYTIPTEIMQTLVSVYLRLYFVLVQGKKIELYPFVGSFYGILGTNRK